MAWEFAGYKGLLSLENYDVKFNPSDIDRVVLYLAPRSPAYYIILCVKLLNFQGSSFRCLLGTKHLFTSSLATQETLRKTPPAAAGPGWNVLGGGGWSAKGSACASARNQAGAGKGKSWLGQMSAYTDCTVPY